MLHLLKNRSFSALTATQFLGAFNDNVFRQFVLLLCVAGTFAGGREAADLPGQAMVGALFSLPFVLFSVLAGSLADKVSKRRVIVLSKLGELAVMGLGCLGLFWGRVDLLLCAVFLMGFQSAVFGPAKYGSIPEILDPRDLSRGNGIIQMTTFLAIIGGTALAGILSDFYKETGQHPAPVLVGVALVGILTALLMRPLAAADPGRSISANPLREVRRNWASVAGDRPLILALLAGGVFMLIGTTLFFVINEYGHWLDLDGTAISLRLAALSLGIAAGSLLAGWISGDRVETGLVPIGLAGMALSFFGVGLAPRSVVWFSVCLTCAGLSAGLFTVPIRALIQQRPRAERKGAVLGISELVDFSGVFLASGLFWLLDSELGFSPPGCMAVLGGLLLIFLGVSLVYTREIFVRLVLLIMVHSLYRIRVSGAEKIPETGGALLVSNHVSFADAFLIGASSPRRVRFMMHAKYFGMPLIGRGARFLGAFPVHAGGTHSQRRETLERASELAAAGDLVCIFPEGAITRTGCLQPFQRGLERIARKAGVPIVPVSLDSVWGSLFSFQGRRVFWKLPRRIPYPLGVQFGDPMPADTPAWRVQRSVAEMHARALEETGPRTNSLPYRFVRSAKRWGGRTALVDSLGKRLSYRRLLIATLSLRSLLRRRLGAPGPVGVLLPPGAGGAVANLALSLRGDLPINLNYTLSNAELAHGIAKARIARVISSRRFLEALERDPPLPGEQTLLAEDLVEEIAWTDKARALLLSLLPGPLLARLTNPVRSLREPATVIFSSGSTGTPKGVVLSHHNIHGNLRAFSEVVNLSQEECMLAVLPFFHSFGYTCTLWAPLLSGSKVVYHANPLDAKTIGRLARKERATVLLGTPTFFQSYLRRCAPEDFASARLIISGAQKLNAALGQEWRERFGSEILQGYGCTELSPVVSVNVPDVELLGSRHRSNKPGSIGQPLPGVAVRVVDPDTAEELAPERAGLLLVRGPGVMEGYLDAPEQTAAVMRDGWYDTGDIALVDRDGFLVITDRLSRFSKIGGEMVPHGRVEEELETCLLALTGASPAEAPGDATGEQDRPELVVAAVDDGNKGEKLVVLHTALPVSPQALTEKLRESSLPKLYLPRAENYAEVAEIPKLGSGKIDLKAVKALAREHFAPVV